MELYKLLFLPGKAEKERWNKYKNDVKKETKSKD